jgi:N-acyl-L-homoserine lactone synthetase
VFCDELGWVDPKNGLDSDDYDTYADHILIRSINNDILATARVIKGSLPWMMERYFTQVIGNHLSFDKKQASFEISRFAVHKDMRGEIFPQKRTLADILLKTIFDYTGNCGATTLYMIVTNTVYRFLRSRGYPVRLRSEAHLMHDGNKTHLCSLTLNDFVIRRHRCITWMHYLHYLNIT